MKISSNDFIIERGYILGDKPLSHMAELRKQAEARKDFYHYTNLEALLKIFSSYQLKLNRIDYMNDQKEKTYFPEDEVAKLCFISSFAYDKNESIPIWHMYTKDSYGVRIGFHIKQGSFKDVFNEKKAKFFKNNTPLEIDWIPVIHQGDIAYFSDNMMEYEPYFPKDTELLDPEKSDSKYQYNLTTMAFLKNDAWKFENETRLSAILETTRDAVEIPNIDYLLLPFDLDKIDSISITLNPWASDEIKALIEYFIKYTQGDNANKFHVCFSNFKDSINRK